MDCYGVGAHVHVAEGIEDFKGTKGRYGKSPVKRLYNAGILRDGTLAVHCVHLDIKDVDLIKRSKATVVHNPVSNLNNAVGISPYLEFCNKRVPVVIGTDGMNSGIVSDVGLASVLHKVGAKDAQAGFNQVKNSVMINAPMFASKLLGTTLGVLKSKAAADLVVYDYKPTTPIGPENYWSHILFGLFSSPVKHVLVDGLLRLKDFNVVCINEKELSRASSKLAKKFWERMGRRSSQ